jgi:hypothetical protein
MTGLPVEFLGGFGLLIIAAGVALRYRLRRS